MTRNEPRLGERTNPNRKVETLFDQVKITIGQHQFGPDARMRIEKLAQDLHGSGLGNRVGIRDQDVLAGGRRRAEVRVRCERQRAFVLEHACAGGHLRGKAAGDVGDHEQLVDLRRERRQRVLELGGVPVRDDDGADLHASTSR